MAAGLATLHVLRQEQLVEHAADMGRRLLDRLATLVDRYEMVRAVRGRGLIIAIEFGPPTSTTLKLGWSLLHEMDQSLFCQAMLIPLLTDHHILAQVAGHHMDVIKLIPPLVIQADDVDEIADAFEAVIAACHRFPGSAVRQIETGPVVPRIRDKQRGQRGTNHHDSDRQARCLTLARNFHPFCRPAGD